MFARAILAAGLAATALSAPFYHGFSAAELDLYNRYFQAGDAYEVTLAGMSLFEDLKQLDADTIEIGKQVETFNGDAAQTIAIQGASEKLAQDIKKAQANVKAQKGTYAVQDSISLLPIFDTFIPDTKKALEGLVSKKALFDKTSTSSVVLSSLQRQKSLGSKLNDMVLARLPAIAKPIDKKQWGAINTLLDTAIKAFSDEEEEAAPAGSAPAAGPAAGAAPAPAK